MSGDTGGGGVSPFLYGFLRGYALGVIIGAPIFVGALAYCTVRGCP